ncbi:MAG TPA: GNAT family N-acetyltransferase [Phototrophicaceae bacterium]|nr:GNAT family N-acetyltransferase [Phototrophicaceae bacterium]
MSVEIYIRPLIEADAEISYQWRNDPEVWKYTGSRPDKEITLEIEKDWVQKVLSRPDEKRFAICLRDTDEYIGNVQLTGINSYEAEFHIFIGEKKYWGKGFGTKVTNLAVEYAFNVLKLQCVYLFVKKENVAAVRAYEKAGFGKIIEDENGNLRLAKYSFDDGSHSTVSVFMMAYNHEKFISQALDGILMQNTDFAVEVVVGEDKSTDKTRIILLDYARKHRNKLKLILHSKNVGASKNQVSVLNACNGKYIAFCEGDDFWTDPDKLQKQVDFLEANPDFAICFHRVNIISDDSLQPIILSNQNQKEISDFDDLARANFIHTASCVFRNCLNIEDLFGFNEIILGDWYLFLLLAQHGKIKFFEDVMANYRLHQGGLYSAGKEKTRLLGAMQIAEYGKKYFAPRGARQFDERLERSYPYLCNLCFQEGSYDDFRKYYKKCLENKENISTRVFMNLMISNYISYVPYLPSAYKFVLKRIKKFI